MASPAQFGRDLTGDRREVTADLVVSQPYKACSALTNQKMLKGRIALIERGDCMFVEKCRRAQNAGAIGVVIVDNKKDSEFTKSPVFAMSGDGSSDVTIPAVFIFGHDGNRLRERLNRMPLLTVRLAEKVLNPAMIFTHFLHRPFDFSIAGKSANNPIIDNSDIDRLGSTKTIRLGNTICYEVDGETIRCKSIDSDNVPSVADIANLISQFPDAVSKAKKRALSPPPLKSDVTTTVQVVPDEKAANDNPKNDQKPEEGRLKKAIDQWIDSQWPHGDDPDRLEVINLLKDFQHNDLIRLLNSENRYKDVVEKLWRLAKETVSSSNTGIEGEDEIENLRIFSPQEKQLLRTLALALQAVNTKEKFEDEP